MNADVIRFEFDPQVSLGDAEMSLHLAMFAVEGLFGRARVRLDSDYQLDEDSNEIAIDTGTEVGAMIVRVFTGLLLREYGEDSFSIHRAADSSHEQLRTACA